MTKDSFWYEWSFWLSDTDSVRDLVLTILAVIGLVLLIWRTIAISKQAAAADSQAKTAHQGHLTDRFMRAVDQFAQEDIATSLGGVYALERVAQDSERDHWPVMETLCAVVRSYYYFDAEKVGPGTWKYPDKPYTNKTIDDADGDIQEERYPDTCAQAIVTVLGRRSYRRENERQILDLRHADLSTLDFRDGYFAKANLSQANLESSNLENANFVESKIRKAKMDNIFLFRAKLSNADLYFSDLTCADLGQADLRYACLVNTYLDGAIFENLNLCGADLSGAKGIKSHMFEMAITDTATKFPDRTAT